MGEAAPPSLGLSPISLQPFPSPLHTVALEVWLAAGRARVGAAEECGESLGSPLCQLLGHLKLVWGMGTYSLQMSTPRSLWLGPGPGRLNRAGSAHQFCEQN